MFGIYHGTASDVQGLMEHVGGYLFAGDEPEDKQRREAIKRERHLVMGISLGGHAAWQLWWNEARVEAAVVVIGCPDYISMLFFFLVVFSIYVIVFLFGVAVLALLCFALMFS